MRIVRVVMTELYGRGDYDWWWDNIEDETKIELLRTLVRWVQDELDQPLAPDAEEV